MNFMVIPIPFSGTVKICDYPRLSAATNKHQCDRQIEHLGVSAALREDNSFELLRRLVQ